MTVAEVFRNSERISIDASPLIYYVEEHVTYVQKLDDIFRYFLSTGVDVICSSILLTEVLMQPLRHQDTQLVEAYRDIVMNGDPFRLVPVTAEIAETAAMLRARYNLRTPDALHIGTAIETHYDAFLTNDKTFKRVQEIRVLVLNELEV